MKNSSTRNHIRHGIKVGLATVLAFVASSYFLGLPNAFWASITTVIVMQMHVADSIRMCAYRFTGTALGAAIGIVIILIFPPTPYFTLLGLFVGSAICAYFTRYNERFRMAAITLVIVYLSGLGDEHRIYFTLFRVAEIGVGVSCAFIVSILLWPSRAGEALQERLRQQYDRAADKYEELMMNFLSQQKKTDQDIFFDLVQETARNREMFHKVFSLERRFFREDMEYLSLQVNVLNSVLDRMQVMPTLLNEVEGEGYTIIMTPELKRLTKAIVDALHALGNGEPYDSHPLASAVVETEERFKELREMGVTRRFEVRRMLQVLGFINTAQHLGEYLLEVMNRPEITRREQ